MAGASRIGLFGGTFDPIHRGHVAMAEAAREACKLDWVYYLPCRISPHKLDRSPASGEHRLEMLELATQDQDWALVNDIETQREGPSFSWMTAEAMKEHMPEARLFWIMGSDQWEALERWNQPQRLADCVEFIVFHRGEEPEPREGYRLRPLPAIHPANATDIRMKMAAGANEHEWLHPDVAAYIRANDLYRSTS